ncbi:MAG: beta-ketoacyl synthase N-terminal-like domain-containing protein [Acidobacteriota bacterium]|nr:beta-ketoacyl synthase N-terminal-like domain-containing protein [Acidobacteriota bacterium]
MTVVVTGYGVLSPLGDTPELFFETLCGEETKAGPVSLFDTEGARCRTAVEIRDFHPKDFLGKKNYRPFNRPALFSIIAAGKALEHAGWAEREDKYTLGMVLGTTYCSVNTIAAFDHNAQVAGPKYAKPMDFANTVINAAAGQTALWHGLQGINSTICCGESSGLTAVGYATEMIAAGRSKALLAGGVEELCFASFHAFDQAGLTAGSRDDRVFPIPFDARRNGFLLGEGSAYLMLEEAEAARARGAHILAEVRGYATGFDVSRGEDAETAIRAMSNTMGKALEAAEMTPDNIDCISACANGSLIDLREAKALAEVFSAKNVPVTAPKAHTGEALGASGAFQALAMVETLRSGRLPGIPRYNGSEEGFPLNTVSAHTRDVEAATGLINGFSEDGNCAVLILSRPGASQ